MFVALLHFITLDGQPHTHSYIPRFNDEASCVEFATVAAPTVAASMGAVAFTFDCIPAGEMT